jgi:hypothetical protein
MAFGFWKLARANGPISALALAGHREAPANGIRQVHQRRPVERYPRFPRGCFSVITMRSYIESHLFLRYICCGRTQCRVGEGGAA